MPQAIPAGGRWRATALSLRSLAAASLLSLLLLGLLSSSAQAAGAECPRKLNDAQPGTTLKPPLALTPTAQSAQRQLNFGDERDLRTIRDLRVTTDRPLPDSVTPAQINFEALLSRTGDALESTDFPDPTFTEPKFSADRKAITFTACLDAAGISAGKYVGTITVSGPAGLGSAAVNLTITAKNSCLFWSGAILAVIISFVLLLFKDAAAGFKKPGDNWWKALKVPLTDLRWWGATAIGLGGAFGALYGIYAIDPDWGASGVAAVIALIGSSFAAIGGKSIVSAFAKPSD